MSRTCFCRKGIAIAVVVVFIVMGLSPVYAGQSFSKVKSTIKNIGIGKSSAEESETDMMASYALGSSEITITDGYGDMFGTHSLSSHLKKGIRFGNISSLDDLFDVLNDVNLSDYSSDLHYIKDRLNRIPTLDDPDLDDDWDIVVPDDYPSIKNALFFAGDGDRIFVKSGKYNENIEIKDSSITLHGENKETTQIIGEGGNHVIRVYGDGCNISGFTITNSGNKFSAIYISSNYNIINDNIIIDNGNGFNLFGACSNHIHNNAVSHNLNGIKMTRFSHGNNFTSNNINNNAGDGINISIISSYNVLYNNIISYNNNCGIKIDDVSRSNIMTFNFVKNNDIGIRCVGVSDGNFIHLNAFIDNILNAFDSSDGKWDNGMYGNYWSDYTGIDIDGDGIGDSPYLIQGGNNSDNRPLMDPPVPNMKSCYQTEINQLQTCSADGNDGSPQILYTGTFITVPDDFSTIQEAVNHSYNGDTIYIKEGTYNEHVIVDKSVKIIGDGDYCTIVTGIEKNYNMTEHESTLIQYQEEDCLVGWGCWGTAEMAQSFFPRVSTLTKVDLKLFKKGSPSGCTISIRDNLNGDDLTSIYMSAGMIPENKNWIEFDFPDVSISPGKVYYIVLDPVSYDADNTFYWEFESNNPYVSGASWIYNTNWAEFDEPVYPDFDFCFKAYAKEQKSMNNHVFNLKADYIEISNICIRDCNGGFSGIRISSDYCNVHDTQIQNCGGGIEIWDSKESTIDNNKISTSIWGIYCHYSTECEVSNNSLINNIIAIQLGYSDIILSDNDFESTYLVGILGFYINNTTILNNEISKTIESGMELFSSKNNLIENNVFSRSYYGSSLHKSKNNIFLFNKFSGNDEWGIGLWFFSNSNRIEGNTLISNRREIYIITSHNNSILNNSLIEGASINHGMDMIYSNGNEIINNTITDIGEHDHFSTFIGMSLFNCNNNTINDNKIFGVHDDEYYLLFLSGGILLDGMNYDNIISNNTIENKTNGIGYIFLGIQTNTIVKNNIILNCYAYGIALILDNSVVENNTVSYNFIGMFIGSLFQSSVVANNSICHNIDVGLVGTSDTIIFCNNFIDNRKHAEFIGTLKYHGCIWDSNYWDKWPFSLPKPIIGYRNILGLDIPLFIDFDYNPAQEPYNFGD